MLLLRDAFGLNRLDRSCPFTEQQQVGERVFSDRELTVAKAAESLRLLTEGVSIRSLCRILHLGQHTVLNLLLRVGEGCERLQRSFVRAVPVSSVQCDELWSYVFCKERCKKAREYRHPEVGDCYVWTAIDPTSKLLLAYALGKRDSETGGEVIGNAVEPLALFGREGAFSIAIREPRLIALAQLVAIGHKGEGRD